MLPASLAMPLPRPFFHGNLPLRRALTAILLLVIVPTLLVVTMALQHAGRSFRDISTNRLLETARVLAQSTTSELLATERYLHRLAGIDPGRPGLLPPLARAQPGIGHIVTRADGSGALPADLPPVLADLIRLAATTLQPQVSDIVLPAVPEAPPLLMMAVPERINGELVSVATLVSHPAELIRALARQGGQAAVVLAITDGGGRIIGRSVDGERLIGRPVPDWATLVALGTASGSFRAKTLEGREIVFAFQRIEGTPGWMAVVGEPVASFDQRWQQPIRTMVLASALTIGLGLLLGLGLVRAVLRPIKGLVEHSRRVAAGEAEAGATVPPSRIAEFETLRESLAAAEAELHGRLHASREAEAHARESLERLLQAERLAGLGSWRIALGEARFDCSGTMLELAGYCASDLPVTRSMMASHFTPEDLARIEAAFRLCATTGLAYGLQAAFRRRDGRRFIAWLCGQPIRDAEGQITGVAGSVQDISERAEQAARLSALADNLPSGVILRLERGADADLTIPYISAGIEALTGLTIEQITARPELLGSAIHREDHPAVVGMLRKADQPGTVLDREFRLIARDGSVTWMRARLALRLQADGPAVWDGVLLDISAERRALEGLQQAKAAAEQAERSKGEFLATMSHEIRTPLNAVIGMARLALRTTLDDRQRGYLNKINESANLLLGIINDILDFSRIEAGGLDLEAAPIRIDALLETVAAVTALRAEEKGLELTFDVAPDTPAVVIGDALRLGQVLTNLVGNAIKFTQSGDIVVAIRPEPDAAPGEWLLHFRVSDTGIGLSPEQIAGLFRPYAQAETGTTRLYGGTGLGLAICRRLVELMGGRIWVDSSPGRGSHFQFTARFAAAGDGIAAPRAGSLPALRGRRVLVVDDNAAARLALQDMIQAFGMQVTVSAEGPAALALLRQQEAAGQPFDLVLVDWRMPGMDGLEVARRIRGDARLHHMPAVLMVTAYGHQLVLSEAGRMDLQGVLLKPVTQSVAFNTIIEALALTADPAPAGGATLRDPASDPDALQLRGRRVLVVDDNALNREVASDLLDLVGVAVETAVNGREAIDRLRAASFDAVLMDVHMPEMNGLEAIRHIRAEPDWADLPVIALTAQARVEDERASLAAGMSAHLTKPIDEAALYRVLAGLLAGPAPAAAAPAAPGGLFAGSAPRFRRFATSFLQDFATMVEEYDQALADGDLTALADQVHRMRGVVGYFDADALAQLGARVEQAARAGDLSLLRAVSPQIRLLMADCLRSVRSRLAALGPVPAPTVPTLAPKAIATRLDALLPLVDAGDFAASAELQRLADQLADPDQRAAITLAAGHFADLDTASAGAILRRLLRELHADEGAA